MSENKTQNSSSSPTDTKAINDKIQNGQVKVKEQKHPKQAKASQTKEQKPKAEQKAKGETQNKAPSDDDVLNALKAVVGETHKPTTSRVISDKLGIENSDFGRGAVRASMRRLTAKKLAKTEVVKEGKTKFEYSVATV